MDIPTPPWSQRSYRRLLIDTQIGDWDTRFLSDYHPELAADTAAAAGAQAVMLYFQSHVGLCYWPTRSGRVHAAFANRDDDIMARQIDALKARGIPVCAYYSVNFNNWAWLEHPDWRLVPAVESPIGGGLLPKDRYGLVCPNNPDYRAFVHAQAGEIVTGYDIDAVFFDMLWWMSICLCDHCRARYRREADAEIPTVIDWLDPAWCRFQTAREQWMTELVEELRDKVQEIRGDLQVYHNFASALANWLRGVSFDSAAGHDFLGGDFYGGRDEQLVVSRLMLNLSPNRPVEFMTTVGANLAEHEGLKSVEELSLQAFAATACSSAFLMIASLDPDGRLNPQVPARIRRVYDQTRVFEPELGGHPVEDIAIYFSSDSKMDFADNRTPIKAAPVASLTAYPHLKAVTGAARAMQRAHLPFGIITRRQLDDLARYPVIVLPNVARMDAREVAAFRAYVEAGGRLYASRLTSLTETSGERHEDFMLADLFGCHFDSEEDGPLIYLKPALPALGEALDQRYLSHWRRPRSTGTVRLRSEVEGRALATLTLPYGYPHTGRIGDHNWASIHSSPPWEELDVPAIVEHAIGTGRVIYSAADIEAGDDRGHESLFIALIRDLLGHPPSFEADTHPAVWMTAFDQPERRRWIVSFLNYQQEHPVLPVTEVRFRLCPPPGCRFTALHRLPEMTPISFDVLEDGRLEGELPGLGMFEMIAASYATTDDATGPEHKR